MVTKKADEMAWMRKYFNIPSIIFFSISLVSLIFTTVKERFLISNILHMITQDVVIVPAKGEIIKDLAGTRLVMVCYEIANFCG
jgi:hypothetical protein